MKTLEGKVAVVTGASRGVGKGVALGLGEAGATVYVTGRTAAEGQATVPLPGTIHQTAAEVSALGGAGIAVRCDHRDDQQVAAVFERVREEQGRLDILVNSAWAGYEGYHDGSYFPLFGRPFWELPLPRWEENLDGGRWAYVASALAAPLLIERRGLVVHISAMINDSGNVAYAVAKTAIDRMAIDMAQQLRPHDVAVVSLYPGLVRTEGVLLHGDYFDLSNSESPQFQGRAVAALAADPERMRKSGQLLVSAELAEEYGLADIDGKRPTSLRLSQPGQG
jgi:NAD(P)-dependent dehydrogenase (short-subunit alcohol dehydrogenase family)